MNPSQSSPKTSFIYEVNLTIDKSIFDENKLWLIDHFHDMVSDNKFIKLELFFVKNTDPINDDHLRYQKVTAQYHIADYETLQQYLEKQANAMRSQVLDRLKGHYSIVRRVLEHVESFHLGDV